MLITLFLMTDLTYVHEQFIGLKDDSRVSYIYVYIYIRSLDGDAC